MSGDNKFLNSFTGGTAGSMAFGPAGMVAGAAMGAGKLKNPFNNKVDVPDATMRPEWSLSGADGKLRSDLLLGNEMPKSFTQSEDVLGKLVNGATAAGPSASAKYLQEANSRNLNNSLEGADAVGNQTLASATNNMAMRGGMDTGSRERLAKSVGFETMMNKQKIRNDATGSDLDILAKDEAQKMDTLKSLPASLLAQAGFQQGNKQFDISNTLGTIGNKYGQDMSGWAANQAAREQAMLANKNSGLLGLGFMGL
jgi:hypothetical protein